MKHQAVSIVIVGIWILSVVAIVVREDVSPIVMGTFALANTIWLVILGYRSPKHPDAQ